MTRAGIEPAAAAPSQPTRLDVSDIKADTHSHQWERRLQENGLAWGAESYVTSLRKAAPFLAL